MPNEFMQNVANNFLALFILFSLFILAYCKWKDKTLGDLIRDIREALKGEED